MFRGRILEEHTRKSWREGEGSIGVLGSSKSLHMWGKLSGLDNREKRCGQLLLQESARWSWSERKQRTALCTIQASACLIELAWWPLEGQTSKELHGNEPQLFSVKEWSWLRSMSTVNFMTLETLLNMSCFRSFSSRTLNYTIQGHQPITMAAEPMTANTECQSLSWLNAII